MRVFHTKYFLALFAMLLLAMAAKAQPFTLDKKLKPVKLQLKSIRDWKDASAMGAQGNISTEGDYYFVKGATMFQPIDIFLLGPDGETVQMELVKNNWEDIQKSASTADAPDGIANLKVRTYGDFGIRIFADKNSDEKYQLLVLASPEVKKALPSPFIAAAQQNSNETAPNKEPVQQEKEKKEATGGNSTLLIVFGSVIFVLLIIVVVLIRRRKSASLLLLLVLINSLFPPVAHARGRGTPIDYERLEKIIKAEKLGKLLEQIKKIKEFGTSTKDFIEEYLGMGECLTMPMPPGMPSIPSFCPDDEQIAIQTDAVNCAGCFTDAREQFNKIRYNLEQLRIIYKCTKDFSKKAIAFGDNASGVHAVTGLAWQAERAKIEGSVKALEEAYDKKYLELIGKLQESMIKLAVCEEQFGTPDWYDRYGYMFYEFVKEKYKRSGD